MAGFSDAVQYLRAAPGLPEPDRCLAGITGAGQSLRLEKHADRANAQTETPRHDRLPTEARRVLASEDHDAEEAQLGAAQGGPCPSFQRYRSHGVHPWRRP